MVVSVQDLPRYVVNFIKRFATGSYASATSFAIPESTDPSQLSRDPFGFRQVIIAATAYGKVFALDSSNGKILWSRILGHGRAGAQLVPRKVYVSRKVGDVDEGGSGEL